MRKLTLLGIFVCLTFIAYSQEICNDGIDNDNDGFIDCFDGNCVGNSACSDAYMGKDIDCQDPPAASLSFKMKLANSAKDRSTLSYGRFVVGDLDRDGIPEVVTVHRDDKKIYILNGTDLSVKKEWSSTGLPEYYDHAIANLDNDNCAEIFVVEEISGKYFVTCYDCTGTKKWSTQAYGQPFTLSLADLDQDGKVELFYKNEVLDAHLGTRLIKGSGDWNTFDAGPVGADLLDDAACTECAGLEIALGGLIYSVDLTPRSADAGALKIEKNINSAPTSAGYFPKYTGFGYVNSQTSVADFNQDGFLDIVMNGATSSSATSTTTVFFWDFTNGTFKMYQPKQTNGSSWPHGTGRINIADIDGDGKLNIMFVSGSRLFALYDDPTKPTLLVSKWIKTISEATSGFTSTTVFDFNNDNAVEIVYRDEKNLYIINGKDGTTFTSSVCRSRTANEYPIVVDVDGDGETEICVSCATDDNVDINNTANTVFGQIRKYESDLDPWVSSRKVWNQHGYFNVNVNDDLTIPKVQQKHHLVFSTSECKTNKGQVITGPNRALNSFLNQSAILDSKGCKTYAAADFLFVNNPGTTEKLTVTAPTCPDKDLKVTFTIRNSGDITVNNTLPVTFYNGNPLVAGATKLTTVNVTLSNFKSGDELTVTGNTVTGPGKDFTLYAVLNDNGSSTPSPITYPNTSIDECNDANNIESVQVKSKPFTLTTSATDHIQCGTANTAGNGTTEAYKLENGSKTTVGYTFYWFDGSTAGAFGSANYTGSVRTGLLNGTYSVYALHSTQQCSSDTVTVTVGKTVRTISTDISVDHHFTDCKKPDGKLTVTPGNDPIGQYTYQWFEGNVFGTSPILSTSHVLADIKAGTYSVLVTEKSTGCETLESGTVEDQTPDINVTVTQVNAVCVPVNSGSATALANNTTSGFTFSWYNGVYKPASDFKGSKYSSLSPGDYYVVAEDNSNGCESDPFKVTIINDANVTVNASPTAQQTSCTTPNVIANVISPQSGIKYDCFKSNNTLQANFIVTGNSATTLAAGDYTVRATQTSPNTGCTATKVVTVTESIVKPTIPVNPSTVNQTKCLPANGSASATAGNSAGPFTYYWFNGNIGSPNVAQANFTGQTYSGLKAGMYTVVAVDNFTNCSSARALATISDGTSIPSITVTPKDQTSCDATAPNGGGTVTTGAGTFRYEWYTGSDTTAAPIATTSTISGKAAGTFTAKAFETSTGCTNAKTISVTDLSAKPVLTLAKSDNINCDATLGYTGYVTSSFSSNANYQSSDVLVYEWKKNGIVVAGETESSLPGASSATLGINAGTYSVTVTNQTLKCKSDPVSIAVLDNTTLPSITTSMTGSKNCSGGTADGSVTVSAVTPADTYEYRWYAGTVAGVGSMLNTSITTATVNGLQGGTGKNYTVEVKLVTTGCKSTATVLLPDNSVLPVLGALGKSDNTFCVGGNGSASVGTVTYNGVAVLSPYTGYSFLWSNGQTTTSTTSTLTAGTYTLTITKSDANCTSDPVSVTINDNQVHPVITASAVGSTACSGGTPTGSITVTGVNPNVSPGYKWFDQSNAVLSAFTSNSATGLTGNQTYTVEVTLGTTQCKSTKAVLVPDDSALPVLGALSKTDNQFCVGGNGSATLGTVTYRGATISSPYTGFEFIWSNGASTTATTISNLTSGSYNVKVKKTTDNCTSDPVAVTINNDQELPAATTTVVGSSACSGGTEDGSITLGTVTPSVAFTNKWFDDASVQKGANNATSITGLTGNKTYSLEVTITATQCKATIFVPVPNISEKPVIGSITKSDNHNCFSPFDGSATLATLTYKGATVPNPFTGYTFSWDGGAASGAFAISAQDNGTHTLTVTKTGVNCTSDPVSIDILDDLEIPTATTTVVGSSACSGGTEDGSITLGTVTPSVAFTNKWFDDASIQKGANNATSITALTGNKTYSLEVSPSLISAKNLL